MVKPTVLNSPPLLCWFYWQTKDHTAIHCIRVCNTMLFNLTGALSSELVRTGCAAPKIQNQFVAVNVDIVAERHK